MGATHPVCDLRVNFYLFKKNTLIQIHAIFNQKPKIFKYRPSRSEFFGFYFEDQSILGGGTMEKFSKNFFNQKLQIFEIVKTLSILWHFGFSKNN